MQEKQAARRRRPVGEEIDVKKQKKQDEPRVVYYTDERNDELSGIERNTIEIGADFPYLRRNLLWRVLAFVAYRVIMTPIAYLHCKIKFGARIVNRRALRRIGRSGCFLYGNHTLMAGDAYLPNLVSFPRRTYVVVNADNLSVKGTKSFIQMCGALPLPTDRHGMRPFVKALETRYAEGHCIMIYPEAHIWPYYTGIRDFSAASFHYPVKLNAPVFCTTTTYSRRRFGKTPRVTLYVDGPFYPDPSLPPRERETALRNSVYETMCRRAEASTYSPVIYRKREETTP